MKSKKRVVAGVIFSVLMFFLATVVSSACPLGDLNGDCEVDWQDIKILQGLWLTEAAAPDPGLVSLWTLDSDTDDSVGGNDAVINGDPQWVTGAAQGAMEFDGDGDYLDCGNDSSLNLTNDFTIALWVKMEGGTVVLTKGIKNAYFPGGAYSINSNGSGSCIFIARDNANADSARASAPVTFGQWTHIAATFSNGNMTIYTNGSEAGSATLSTTTINTNADPLVIGAETGDPPSYLPKYLTGCVDDVRIYDSLLSEPDIIALSGPVLNGDLDIDDRIDANDFAIVADQWKTAEFPGFIIDDDITATACSGTGPQETVNYSGLIKGLHDMQQTNMWRSVAGGAGGSNPNPGSEAGAAWIKYEFDKAYDIKDIWLWNYNEAGSSDNGMRNVSIEYSTNGSSYAKLGDYEIPQAFGAENMGRNFEVDLGDVSAKYVVITAKATNGNWGGSHYGLSEVRFNLSQTTLVTSVGRSLPVRGQTYRINVEELVPYNITPGSTIDFYAQLDDQTPVLQTQETMTLPAYYDWTPTQNGSYKLWCDLDGTISTIREVFVTEKKLHFTFWGSRMDLKYITGYMSSYPYSESQTRLNQGVMPLQWKNGMHIDGYSDVDYYNYWRTLSHPTVQGIMIDEFGSGGDKDDTMGRALIMLRDAYPDMFLAPYTVSAGGDDKIAGFAVSDVVQVETYASDFRFYDGMFSRYENVIARGLADNTVACIGFGSWVQTVTELRQQLDFVRTTFPDMPGLNFYGTGTAMQYDALDGLLYDYYLAPAIRAEVVASTLEVRNIGSLIAEDVNVIFHTTGGDTVTQISSITPDATSILSLPGGFQSAEIAEAPGRYTVVDYVRPDLLPPPDAAANAEAAAYRATFSSAPVLRPLEGTVDFDYFTSPDDDEIAELNLSQTVSGRVAMAFDFDLVYSHIYGWAGVRLGDGSPYSFGFRMTRHEPDGNVSGSGPRAFFLFHDITLSTTLEFEIVFPPSMDVSDGKYYFFAAYDPAEKSLRAMMLARTSGALIYDTGFVPVSTMYQNPSYSKFRFETGGWDGYWYFDWDDALDEMEIQGGYLSYLLRCRVRNVEIMY
ncbi:LamG-like jellyroll fold domain-containing protein [Planctomycetota bacterium]